MFAVKQVRLSSIAIVIIGSSLIISGSAGAGQEAEAELQRIGAGTVLQVWHGSDGRIRKQVVRACLADGRLARVEGKQDVQVWLDEAVAADIVARLAPAEAVGARLCAVETVNGPHRLQTEYFDHAAVMSLRTSGRLESVTIDWRECGCPFLEQTPPN